MCAQLSHSLLAMILFHTKLTIARTVTFTKSGTVEIIPPITATRLSPDSLSVKNREQKHSMEINRIRHSLLYFIHPHTRLLHLPVSIIVYHKL
ncbi:unnamed protein product [Brugia pahangi]|uniref:Secreted protein n=1 Tax=Brugia pahangi TaxID=6280 RepID=A0A0N4TKQ7_BRUPA|nr:unnamed protein product [Brugia pahangi]